MIKVIIFDYDDTLVKSSEALYLADSKTAISLGLEKPSGKKYFALWGKPHVEIIKLLHPFIEPKKYLEAYKKIYIPSQLELFSDVKLLLRRLSKKKIRLAVLSSKQKAFLEEHLRYTGIRDFIEYVHCAESSIFQKPDPRVFDDVLKYFKTEPSGILYVGDQVNDFKAASGAGLQFVAVTTGIDGAEDFIKAGCKRIISSLGELDGIIG